MGNPRHLLMLAALLAALLLMSGCSDDDNPTTVNQGDPPTFDADNPAFEYTPPAAMQTSGDAHAQMAVNHIGAISGIAAWMTNLTPPPEKAVLTEKGGPWVYTWEYGEGEGYYMAYRLTVTELSDRYRWTLHISGNTDEYPEKTFTNVLFYAAEAGKDGSWGWFEIYDYVTEGGELGSGDVVYSWAWETVQGVTTVEHEYEYDDWGERIVLVFNADESGSIDYSTKVEGAWVLTLEVNWNADGSGTWAEYSETGELIDSGSWSSGPALAAEQRLH